MIATQRRMLMAGASLGLARSILGNAIAEPAATRTDGTLADGHAAGLDVAPAPNPLPLIPRRTGPALDFTASLDTAPLKQTSGGWAREVTTRTLPIATALAGAHLFINPGGCREMHWHNSDEWALVLGGHGQVTAVDATGEMEVVNVAPGDLWYFPRGHAHAIQTLGTVPLNAILVFNDGLYAEHGTFGLSDWMSRIDPAELNHALGLPPDALAGMPAGETYINQGTVLDLNGPEAAAERPWPSRRSHRFGLMRRKAQIDCPAGITHRATAADFPVTAMAASVTHLQPGAMQQLHWHIDANEWHYVIQGRLRVMMFGPDKRIATADLGPGDCAYLPATAGHTVKNIGQTRAQFLGVLDTPHHTEAGLSDWLRQAPAHLLANNLDCDPFWLPPFPPVGPIIGA